MTEHGLSAQFATLSGFQNPDDYFAFFEANATTLIEAAQQGHKTHGGGFVLLPAVGVCFVKSSYVTVDETDEWLTPAMASDLASYDPDLQIMVGVDEHGRGLWLWLSNIVDVPTT